MKSRGQFNNVLLSEKLFWVFAIHTTKLERFISSIFLICSLARGENSTSFARYISFAIMLILFSIVSSNLYKGWYLLGFVSKTSLTFLASSIEPSPPFKKPSAKANGILFSLKIEERSSISSLVSLSKWFIATTTGISYFLKL